MLELSIYQNLGTRFLIPPEYNNPTQIGHARRIAALYVIGRFGFSSKTVIQYLLGIRREAINKLFRKLVTDGLINERKSFGSKDGAVYYLSAKGKRFISFETELEYHQKTDTSAHNSKTEIHDLSIQICMINRLLHSRENYTAFVTEKELRELGYGTFGELRNERAVDGLLYLSAGDCKDNCMNNCSDSSKSYSCWHSLEIETSNAKNKRAANNYLRPEILEKYRRQLVAEDGLYSRVLFFSHRERFLRQIAARTDEIIKENALGYTDKDIEVLTASLKYVHSFCPTLYELFWNPDSKLDKDSHIKIDQDRIEQAVALYSVNSSNEYQQGLTDVFRTLGIKHPDIPTNN
ncbi:hypothetical protein [Thalassotalea litorea]|uniref:hypothetical protein n=1 Tax=Thalassotalea litorea TaxID=2020715 RepID=UPI0037353D1F